MGASRPQRLSRRLTRHLTDPASECFLSPVSVWEALLLIERGRLVLGATLDPVAWIRGALAASNQRTIPLSTEIAIQSRRLERHPAQDPADRFLIATCLVEDLVLATADDTIRKHGGVRTLA